MEENEGVVVVVVAVVVVAVVVVVVVVVVPPYLCILGLNIEDPLGCNLMKVTIFLSCIKSTTTPPPFMVPEPLMTPEELTLVVVVVVVAGWSVVIIGYRGEMRYLLVVWRRLLSLLVNYVRRGGE